MIEGAIALHRPVQQSADEGTTAAREGVSAAIDAHYAALVRRLTVVLRDEEAARDVAQETCLEERTIPTAYHATVAATESGFAYLYESTPASAQVRLEVSAFDLGTGSERIVYRSEPYDPLMRAMRIASTHEYTHGVELPPGWFLVFQGTTAIPGPRELEPPLAVRVADGLVVELPALGG